ncbi:NAD(P)-dependent dehydrogenase (short-subunit alcohol dehydrogenase family) [Thermocatellispora tengchongensis]|uniref:NAD(P)-dependent dehydrogenase (Short-subunit alcohol dehydrogenase family) n=1 Tax=Thermocatellispora tengchongensis TaxID=1073253 RepID=A0A840PKC2_9ACTN|nr:SDR family NAD(P)-dependent oxidoreductase [Thermocatellispora tengchongensis]MBB5137517.1 NAD(P)-dependent dehydrogenase (short-subunit alcohol dehydrogenase family) [Thermocatellispora tengchongensis]
MKRLAGRVAVITGAAGGIGRAMARRFAAEGMALMLSDIEEKELAATARLAASAPEAGKVLTQVTDVSDAAAVRDLADRAFAEFGEVHLLCNNAGVLCGGRIWTREPADFAWSFGVNTWGVLHGIRAFVPRMIEQGTEGHIVNTVSVAGLLAGPYAAPYAVSKYAAFAATQCLAQDLRLAGSRLKVTALCPGVVRTGIARSERNRPPELAATGDSDDGAAMRAFAEDSVRHGIDPAEVAAAVVEAVRAERFLVLTHPRHADGLRAQTRLLLAGEPPPVPAGE